MAYNILYLNSASYVGGAEISLLTTMGNLDADQYIPFLVTSSEGMLSQQTRKLGIPTYFQDFPMFSKRKPWEYFSRIIHLVRIIQNLKIDLVHTNCDQSLNYAKHAFTIAKIPYVSYVRDFVRSWFKDGNITALKQAKYTIATSNAVAKACSDAGINQNQIITIYNPINVEAYQQTKPDSGDKIRNDIGISKDDILIGIVGQIQPIKGQREFILAGLKISEIFPQIHFIIAGSTNSKSDELYLEQLKSLLHSSPHKSRFHFLGFRNDVPNLMTAIDIIAVPSLSEAFGRVVVEGMLSGCAVVGSNTGGIPEIITNELDGLLIQPGNINELFSALARLISNPNLRYQFAERSKLRAQRFSVKNHIDDIQSVYKKILK